ncbi:MAG: dihydrolipoamide acetyltransferase family protein [Phycisphaerales bacterium]
MASNITMPRLSDTMEVGTIVKWHIAPGAKVKSGDVIADIETDKATMELQTFEDGVVADLVIKAGQSAPVGTVIARFEGGTGGGASTPTAQSAAVAGAGNGRIGGSGVAVVTAPAANGVHGGPGGNSAERVFASPLARKIAAESGVDLKALEGTGPSGRIIRRDVEAFIAAGGSGAVTAPAPAPVVAVQNLPRPSTMAVSPIVAATVAASAITGAPVALAGRVVALSNMRRTIAARLVESKTTIPHYQVTVSVRMDALLSLRGQLNEQLASHGVKLSVNDFLVRACALSMHQHPFVNARWAGPKGAESIEIMSMVSVGVAVSLPEERGGGLVVATIRSADQKGLRLISAETRALAEKARTKGLTVEEMSESTFTISNLGMFGVEHFTAIINPPNAAILAVGAAVKKPVIEVVDGKETIVIGHEMQMTMSSDHRIVDGAMAAQYLASVRAMLEKPATLLV